MSRFLVDEAARLDHFLRDQAGLSRRLVARLCAEGRVRVGGRPADKGALLAPGDEVEVDPAALGPFLAPAPLEGLRVLLETPGWVVVDKPAGIPSHPLRPGEGGTLADGLAHLFPECADASPDPREAGLVHRLDNGTSGAILAARDRGTWERLRGLLSRERIKRAYRAIVVGEGEDAVYDAPLDGKRARTSVRVLGRGAGIADLEIELEGGRRHQIRRHLAEAGFPILGDTRYGAPAGEPRMWLHSYRIQVEEQEVEAPLPAGWASCTRRG